MSYVYNLRFFRYRLCNLDIVLINIFVLDSRQLGVFYLAKSLVLWFIAILTNRLEAKIANTMIDEPRTIRLFTFPFAFNCGHRTPQLYDFLFVVHLEVIQDYIVISPEKTSTAGHRTLRQRGSRIKEMLSRIQVETIMAYCFVVAVEWWFLYQIFMFTAYHAGSWLLSGTNLPINFRYVSLAFDRNWIRIGGWLKLYLCHINIIKILSTFGFIKKVDCQL